MVEGVATRVVVLFNAIEWLDTIERWETVLFITRSRTAAT